jgi:protein subunit release factor A
MENSINEIGVALGWTELGIFTLLFSGLQFLMATWLKSRIESSIKHEYDQQLEKIKATLSFNSKKREESALVAELLAEWVSKPETHKTVNKLLWEASLWLPDEETKELNNLLAHEGDITTKQMLVKIRKIIQGCETTVTADDLTSFRN